MHKKRGDCFEVALELGVSLDAAAPDDVKIWIVHGRPVGRGPENRGKHYWHGWIEVERSHPNLPDVIISYVVDYSNGLETTMPRETYYDLGQIEKTWRFTIDEAQTMALETFKTYGPWVEDWEKY